MNGVKGITRKPLQADRGCHTDVFGLLAFGNIASHLKNFKQFKPLRVDTKSLSRERGLESLSRERGLEF